MSYKRIKGVFLRYFYELTSGFHSFADIFYWPLVDILLWGLTSRWIDNQTTNTQQHISLVIIIMTALIFWQMVWRGAIDISVNLLLEFWGANLVNLFATPLKITEWVIGNLCIGFLKLSLTLIFGAFIVYYLYALNVFTLGWAFLPYSCMLIIFGWALGFFSAGVIMYYGTKASTLVWIFPFIFSPFSAVFYPVEVLPKWARIVSWCLPSTYVFEGMRKILLKGEFDLNYLIISFTLNIVYLILSISFFKNMFNKSRKLGLTRLT